MNSRFGRWTRSNPAASISRARPAMFGYHHQGRPLPSSLAAGVHGNATDSGRSMPSTTIIVPLHTSRRRSSARTGSRR
jgi:hypothetical protein